MKNNLSIQPSTGANTMIARQSPFPCIDLVNKISEYASKFIPARASASFGPVSPIMKIYGNETGLNLFFNLPLKQVAARLSDIELALDCYDVSSLQISIHDLKNLFIDRRMPAVGRLAVQMEESARENQWQGVKDLLREIKKIIVRVVKHRMQPRD